MLVNGNEYKIPDLDYNAICDMADYGANLLSEEWPSSQTLIRAVLALSLGSVKRAGAELQAHIEKRGIGDMADWMTEIKDAIEESGFFSAIREAAEAEAKKAADAAERKAKREKAKAGNTED